jgi:hypothetical protein
MKFIKTVLPAGAALLGFFLASCQQPDPVYVPVYVPTEKKEVPKKKTYRPKPKPVETAEGFRAVEKPETYSN